MPFRRFALVALAATFLFTAHPAKAVSVVDAGFNLFTTVSPTTISGYAFQGVPLGSFDFGGSVGVKSTGSTDTIIQRTAATSVSNPVPIELVALHLQSIGQVNFQGFGLDNYFLTLQKEQGGPASLGQMT